MTDTSYQPQKPLGYILRAHTPSAFPRRDDPEDRERFNTAGPDGYHGDEFPDGKTYFCVADDLGAGFSQGAFYASEQEAHASANRAGIEPETYDVLPIYGSPEPPSERPDGDAIADVATAVQEIVSIWVQCDRIWSAVENLHGDDGVTPKRRERVKDAIEHVTSCLIRMAFDATDAADEPASRPGSIVEYRASLNAIIRRLKALPGSIERDQALEWTRRATNAMQGA